MKRNAMESLVKWKSSEERKPLVLKGAQQVGKTWLMKEFGKGFYESCVYFNFDEEDELKSIFETNKNPHRIIELLSMIANEKILPESTLIIFDEIQECPKALNTLKYFKEKANDYHVIASYFIIGGMPECVASWVKYKDPLKISNIQRELIEVYENDFSKHNGKVNSGRILMVFRSIATQLAKPNEKFMYGAVREGGRTELLPTFRCTWLGRRKSCYELLMAKKLKTDKACTP